MLYTSRLSTDIINQLGCIDAYCARHSSTDRLTDKQRLRYTYHSNAIEGNALDLEQTQLAINGKSIPGKSPLHHQEAVSHNYAISRLLEIVKSGESFNRWHIAELHEVVLGSIDRSAGRFRLSNVRIAGAQTTPPHALQVPEQIDRLIQWNGRNEDVLHPIERAVVLHVEFVRIHPFTDGNGRVGRLLMNAELLKAGMPLSIIKYEQQFDYYAALELATIDGNYEPIMRLVINSLDCPYLGVA